MTKSFEISEVRTRLIRIPVDPPRGDAIQKFSNLELPLVEISDRAGNKGVGFSYTIGQGGTTICELLRRELTGKLLGKDSRRITFLGEFLKKCIHALTPGVIASDALAAIDVALWDLQAKRMNIPLHLLLGGAKEEVPIYNTHVGWLDRPLKEMVELCHKAVTEEGFHAVKLKVGKQDPEEDFERVSKVREAVGPKIKIMVDANQSWTIDEAVPRIKMLEPCNLVWVEEPLLATDIQGFKTLGRHTRIPRAGGESLYTPADFYEYLRQGALDILQPDVARLGGITPAMEVCSLAKAANLQVAPHVSPELSVVVAAAVSNSMFVEFIPQMEPILKRRIEMINGMARPSSSAGHGIELDEEAINRYEVKDERLACAQGERAVDGRETPGHPHVA